MKRSLIFLLALVCTTTVLYSLKKSPGAVWNSLLQKHVNDEGNVDYKGIIQDKAKLQEYLNHLSQNPPKASDNDNAKMAYWINAYNAFTIKAIIDHYPLKSITDIKPESGAESIWKEPFFSIGGKKHTLDHIENGILRKDFNDPRIHFAINCASASCPKLWNHPFTEGNVKSRMEALAKEFVNDPSRNKIAEDQVKISKIFDWFKSDFTQNGTIIQYLNTYSNTNISKDASVGYLPYDWSLNEQ